MRAHFTGLAILTLAFSLAANAAPPAAGAGVDSRAPGPNAAAAAAPLESSPERYLFDSVNRERAMRGVPELSWDMSLASSARQHAEQMADRNALSHQFSGEADLALRAAQAGARFTALAENVAFAATPSDLHEEWMNSPPHRANLLDPNLNSIGIAVVARGGELFAVQDFSRAVADLTIEQQEEQLGTLVQARGLRLLGDHDEARRACASSHEWNADMRAFYLMRFDTDSLDNLPDALNRTIASGRYRQAAVGACSDVRSDGFSSYRLAVLLF
jgi:uncharacterized protein YkwD